MAWPQTVELLSDVTLSISPRAISVDLLEEPEEIELQEALLGERSVDGSAAIAGGGGGVSWSRGTLRAMATGNGEMVHPLSESEALRLLTSGAVTLAFLRKGKTFRMYNIPSAALKKRRVSGASADSNAAAAEDHADPSTSGMEMPHTGSGSRTGTPPAEGTGKEEGEIAAPVPVFQRGKHNRERYSQAVAFEFVNNVLADILTVDPTAMPIQQYTDAQLEQ